MPGDWVDIGTVVKRGPSMPLTESYLDPVNADAEFAVSRFLSDAVGWFDEYEYVRQLVRRELRGVG